MAKLKPEMSVQRSVQAWLRQVLPAGSILAALNTEVRGTGTELQRMRYGAARKASGILPGFFDATALLPGRLTVWFEWKAASTGVISEAQQRVHAQARALGHIVIVADGIESCRYGLHQAGIALNECFGQPEFPAKVRFERARESIDAAGMPF